VRMIPTTAQAARARRKIGGLRAIWSQART
jgi:hypothetical protein